MISPATSLDLSINADWLDCSTGAVATGIEQSGNGQITRVYYESYGNPEDDIGDRDSDSNKPVSRRMLTLRAIDVIPFTSDTYPTVVLVDDDGTSFYLTQLNRVAEYPSLDHAEIERDMKDADTEHVLAVQDGDKLVPIGVHVALAIPDHERMSPQLASTTE
jgi:hypothetical protein